MSQHPVSLALLQEPLKEFFRLGEILECSIVRAGHMCHNYAIATATKRYFLKQYRPQSQPSVLEVKEAETFFAKQGFPVILPLKTNLGEVVFEIEGSWFSLFPFVEGHAPRASELTKPMIKSLATMLARMHRAGIQDKPLHYAPIRLWKREDFFESLHRLESFLLMQESVTPMQQFALNSLRIQAEYLDEHREIPEDFSLRFDCLLHGDFIYTNVFFDAGGEINAIYDFERTGIGPRAYELARSLFLTCFDDGWEKKNHAFAGLFLKAYLEQFPLEYDEFLQGARMYAQHFMHMTWLESKVILESSGSHIALLIPARRRTVRFEEGIEAIIEKIWPI